LKGTSVPETPRITLNNGRTIPQLGFGTLNVPPDREPTPENTAKTAEIVGLALEAGYRHIDTAQGYGNERGVGDAIKASGIPRDELFVTTKLGSANHRPDDVKRSFEESLEKLSLDYVDLFLIHWPLPMLYDGDFVSTWKAISRLVEEGTLRSGGVSNVEPEHLERIISATGVVPAVNQIELHPNFLNADAAAACVRHGIAVESWSPLGHGALLNEPVIAQVAQARQKSPAQVLLRWHVQHNLIVIPKSMHRERIEENAAIFDFELTADEMTRIDAMDKGEAGRTGPNPNTFGGPQGR
jgi:2,5-diketo-D-gluconate reductase A